MANTFVKIASVTVGSGGAASIDFTSIPSTYTDLCVKMSFRQDIDFSNDGNIIAIEFNSAGSASFSGKLLFGTGSAAGSAGTYLNAVYYTSNPSDYTSNTFGNGEIYIPNYAGSQNKSFSSDSVYENNATAARQGLQAGLWSSSSAITSVKLSPFTGGGKFVQYSTATLYGIKNS
jgi:hypothetical protein